MASITLRYFDCRGRAQPLRFFLDHLDVPFADERVPFTDGWQAWASMKRDPVVSGPFGKLPVLHWDERLLVETGPLYGFAQVQLAPSAAMGAILEAQSALSDDLALLYQLLNLDVVAHGADLGAMATRVHSTVADSFERYEAWLGRGENPFDVPRFHSVAAFWLLEVWSLAQTLFGRNADVLIDGRPRLRDALGEIARLPAVATAGERIPRFWSARPDEPDRLRQLHADLASPRPSR
jgi:hypothetical protein